VQLEDIWRVWWTYEVWTGHDLLQRCDLQATDVGSDDDGDYIILACVSSYNTEQPSEQNLQYFFYQNMYHMKWYWHIQSAIWSLSVAISSW